MDITSTLGKAAYEGNLELVKTIIEQDPLSVKNKMR
jgi:hypothetical protein